MRIARPIALVAGIVVLAGALSSCGKDSASSSAGSYDVKAGDTTCDVAKDTIPAGDVTFVVENSGSDVTEVYVYGKDGENFTKIMGEVENIGPGTSRDLDVTLTAGDYQIACKPGMVGDGIRADLTVTGRASSSAEDDGTLYDRELEFEVDGSGVVKAPTALAARVGEKIEFKLQNASADDYYLELLDPGGSELGEAEAVAGGNGEFISELKSAGDFTVSIYADGAKDHATSQTLTVSGGGTDATPTDAPNSTQAPAPTEATSDDSTPRRAKRAQIMLADLPGFNEAWVWDDVATTRGPSSDNPSVCLQTSMEAIGGVAEYSSRFTSSASPTDVAFQVTAVFPDEQTAVTAESALTTWQDTCRAYAAGKLGLERVRVDATQTVSTVVGAGQQRLISYGPVPRDADSAYFNGEGFVRDGDVITYLVLRNVGQDYSYKPGHQPVDLALKVAADYLRKTR